MRALEFEGLLAGSVGVPFLVVSATAPLLQRWFTETGHPAARDPYFLYAASNLGSIVGLLGYPLLVEPRLSLTGTYSQTALWSASYGVLAVLIVLCALAVWRNRARGNDATSDGGGEGVAEREPPTRRERARWIALSECTMVLTVLGFVCALCSWTLPLAEYGWPR